MHASALLRPLRDQRGATLPLVALSLVTLLSIAALAVDYGMLASAHAAAQRAADAAALAGASTYMETTPSPDTARSRAFDFAMRNHILTRTVDSSEVSVGVDDANATVTVRVGRVNIPTFFARLFGEGTADVNAFASARVALSGTAACVKPFALPNTLYTGPASIGTMVKIWEQKDDGDGLVLVGDDDSPPGLGNDVREMLSDTTCAGTLSTGSRPYRAPDDTRLGQVRNGFDDLTSYDPQLTWSADGQFEGFNRENWVSSPRIGVVPLYDPVTSNYQLGGTGTLHITGFLTVFFDHMQTTAPPRPRAQVYGVILRSIGVSDVCGNTLCSQTTPVLQLIR